MLMQTLLPLPVAPTIKTCSNLVRSAITGLPATSFPRPIGQFGSGLLKLGGFDHLAKVDDARLLIGHFDADHRLARHRRFDANVCGGEVERHVVREVDDLAHFDARSGLQLVTGDHRTAADVDHLGLHAKGGQRLFEETPLVVGLLRPFVAAFARTLEQRGIGQDVGRRRLGSLGVCGHGRGLGPPALSVGRGGVSAGGAGPFR